MELYLQLSFVEFLYLWKSCVLTSLIQKQSSFLYLVTEFTVCVTASWIEDDPFVPSSLSLQASRSLLL